MGTNELYLASPATIIVEQDAVRVLGKRFASPVSESMLIASLGSPDRIVDGQPPAPPGHRNNEAYIYDDIGIYWLRDHKSGLMMALTAAFRRGRGPFRVPFMPSHPFSHTIELPHCTITSRSNGSQLKRDLQGIVKHFIGGMWAGYVGPFHLSFTLEFPKWSTQQHSEGDLVSVSIGFGRLTGQSSTRSAN